MNRIIRVKSEKGFTIIPNVVFNSGLSLRSIGLLSYILHLPDDWVLYKSWLYDNMPCDGRDSINTAWNQLTEKGFIVIERSKGGGRGNLPEINYKVYDKPVKDADFSNAENPATEKQQESGHNSDKSVGFPLTGFPQRKHRLRKTRQLLNTNILSTKEQSTNTVNTSLVPDGTTGKTPSVEIEEKTESVKKSERLQAPDDSAEIKKERNRYETEIYPEVVKMVDVDAKRKLAEYIREKKPAFYEPYMDLWNRSAPANGLAKIKKLSIGRENKVKTRLKDPDFDFIEVMMAIKKSNMLKGDNQRGWKVDFDFIFANDTNYLKIVEGKYQ